MSVEVSKRNHRRLVELRQKIKADSMDEVIDMLIDFWYSWHERKGDSDKVGFGYDT